MFLKFFLRFLGQTGPGARGCQNRQAGRSTPPPHQTPPLAQALLDLNVQFTSKIANELMTEVKGTAVNMCYQLKLGLENAKDGGGRPVHRSSARNRSSREGAPRAVADACVAMAAAPRAARGAVPRI